MTVELAEHNLIKVKIDDVKLDRQNPNQMSQQQMAALRQSMQRWGYLTPIIIDQNNEICDGEHRLLVYKELGYEEIPAFKLTLQDDSERLMIRQVMNKLHGEHEKQLDSNELATLFNASKLEDLARLIAQRREELEQAISKFHPDIWFNKPEDFAFEAKDLEEIVPTTKLGDLYQLGSHRLICADCTDKRSIDRLVDDETINLVFTDPPYNIDFDYNQHEDAMTASQYSEFCSQWYNQILKPICDRIIITPGPRNVGIWFTIEEPKDIATWYKPNSSSYASLFYKRTCEPILFYGNGFLDFINQEKGGKKRSMDFYEYLRELDPIERNIRSDMNLKKFAPTKPLNLVTDLVAEYSNQGETVLDLFTGSGTTLIACQQKSRNFLGVEIDPHYCDVIVKRWESYSGSKAELV